MTLSSLGLASRGYLDGGSKPMLHLATDGLIRLGGVVEPEPPTGGGGGGIAGVRGRKSRGFQPIHPSVILKRLEAQLDEDTQERLTEGLEPSQINLTALDAAIQAQLELIPQDMRKTAVVSLDISRAAIISPSFMRARLLLLMGG